VTLLRPDALPLLALAPAVWILLALAERGRRRRLRRLAGPRAPSLAAERSGRARALGRALTATGLLLLLVALLGPLWGARDVERRGVDLVLCLDVSRSMLARDVEPDRLAAARAEIRALAERARGDRLALVAFAGEARTLCPLTDDMASFVDLLELATPLAVRRGGSDLAAALETAMGLLPGRTGEHEAIVLLTDGEDLAGRGLAAARRSRELGITVHCVGYGTALGSKIAVGDKYLRDRSGVEVVSALDAPSLDRIADATGGAFAEAPALLRLYEEKILPLAPLSFAATEERRQENRFQIPLLAAILLWLADLSLSDRRRR
jgi:Ca-activated chloride channel family protein